MRRALAAAALAAFVLAGCGESDEPTTAEQPAASETPTSDTPSESEEPTEESSSFVVPAIEVEIEGDRIEPNGKRVKVGVGEPVALHVESDRPAELHVHSSPEQVLEVEEGESTLTLSIERPGIVHVEEHETGKIVLQLEVR